MYIVIMSVLITMTLKIFNFMGGFFESFFVQPFVLEWQERVEQDMVDHNRELLSRKLESAINGLEVQNRRLHATNEADDVTACELNGHISAMESALSDSSKLSDREEKRIKQTLESARMEYDQVLTVKGQRFTFIQLNSQIITVLKIKKDTVDNGSIDTRLMGGTDTVDEFIETVSRTIAARDTTESANVLARLSLAGAPVTYSGVKAMSA
uniref:ORF40/ORF81 n=1 Tax=Latid herpesvirus 1 TaxID=3096545 RepID=A0AB33V6K5_9VIRU